MSSARARNRTFFGSKFHPSAQSPPRPIRLWQIFPLVFICVYLTHITLLRLPYYWDEAGYYVPAAYDFLRTGSLIPYSTLSNAHPPLPSLYLALWWKASGFIPAVTRVAMCIITALALLGTYQLTIQITRRWGIALSVTLLTLLYPVWFAQATLAHADMFAAAATIWALCFYFKSESSSLPDSALTFLFFSLAVLSKETAIATPLALAALELYFLFRLHPPRATPRLLALVLPLAPLLGWYFYHRHKTGYMFGNPEYVRYNATGTLSPLRFLLALGHRLFHLGAHMNMFVPVLCAAASWILAPRLLREGNTPIDPLPRAQLIRLWTILIANTLLFSILGGALLTRYLLPLYPLVILLCVYTWFRRVREWPLLVLLATAAFITGIFINPPYRFSPEDNLSYRDTILLQQQAIPQLRLHYPHSTVLTAWPATDELTKPELGYVRTPLPVVAINDFSLPSIERAGQSNLDFTTALVFSTKYDPPSLPFDPGEKNRRMDARYFSGHQDLSPSQVARLLNGTVEWQASRNGQWAAILHFDRPQLAQLRCPGPGYPRL